MGKTRNKHSSRNSMIIRRSVIYPFYRRSGKEGAILRVINHFRLAILIQDSLKS